MVMLTIIIYIQFLRHCSHLLYCFMFYGTFEKSFLSVHRTWVTGDRYWRQRASIPSSLGAWWIKKG